jgi:hypothetical protein
MYAFTVLFRQLVIVGILRPNTRSYFGRSYLLNTHSEFDGDDTNRLRRSRRTRSSLTEVENRRF